MPVAVLAAFPYVELMDDNGNPLSGGKVFTYAAGTSFSVPLATYTDNTGTAFATNPIILDAAGRATVWISGSYDFVVKTSADVPIRTIPNVTSYDNVLSRPTLSSINRNSFTIRPTNGTNAWTAWVSNTSVQALTFATRDSTDVYNIDNLASSTKLISATFVAGTGNGGLATGAVAANTTYHFFALVNPLTNAVDFGYDTSLSATNLLANANVIAGGFTRYRRIASVLTNASSQIRQFVQANNLFFWDTVLLDVNSAISTAGTLYSLAVPSGIKVNAICTVTLTFISGGPTVVLFNDPARASVNPVGGNAQGVVETNGIRSSCQFGTVTNTSAQIRGRALSTSGSHNCELGTQGYEDFLLT